MRVFDVWGFHVPVQQCQKSSLRKKTKAKQTDIFSYFKSIRQERILHFTSLRIHFISLCHLFAKIFQVSSREKLGLCCEILQPHIGTHRHTLCAHLQDSKSSLNIRKWGSLNTDTLTGEAQLLYFKWPLHVVSLSYNIAGICNIFCPVLRSPLPHGLVVGHKWCDQVCRAWGGRCLNSQVCLWRLQPLHLCCTLPGSPTVKQLKHIKCWLNYEQMDGWCVTMNCRMVLCPLS